MNNIINEVPTAATTFSSTIFTITILTATITTILLLLSVICTFQSRLPDIKFKKKQRP